MAYEPLHHKYRPQMFQDLVGQTAIATTLTHALQQQRIAPAYLFTGPRGTGKTSSARILAKSLNCIQVDRPTATPCGQCEVCHGIIRGTALDVIEIDAASNTGVDNIRELIEKSQFAPVQCRYKVYVIDECHMLSTAAFNALLKTLEEPPDRVVFVLATTDPQRVLPTIISRCQRFDFRRIPLEPMIQHLQYIARQENITITDPAVTLVAQIAQGGLRDAESLLDQLSLLPPPITPEAVWDLVGAVPERDLLALTQAIASQQPETILDVARQLMNRGREPLIVLQNLASFYRDLLIAKTAPQRPDLVAITTETWQQMCSFTQGINLDIILRGQQHLRSSEVQLKNTTQPRLWLEVTLMGLLPSTLGAAASIAAVSAPPIALGTVPPAVPPVVPPAPSPAAMGQAMDPAMATYPMVPAAPAAPPQSPGIAPTPLPAPEPGTATTAEATPDLGQLWQRIMNRLESKSTKALLEQHVHLVSFQGSRAMISSPPGLKEIVHSRLDLIQQAFSQVVGRSVAIQVETLAKASPPPGVVTVPPNPVSPPSPPSYGSPAPPSPVSAAYTAAQSAGSAHAPGVAPSPPLPTTPPAPTPGTAIAPASQAHAPGTPPSIAPAPVAPAPVAPAPIASDAITTGTMASGAVASGPVASGAVASGATPAAPKGKAPPDLPTIPTPSAGVTSPTAAPNPTTTLPNPATPPAPPSPTPTPLPITHPAPSTLATVWSEDEVVEIAKQFAEFFRGERVQENQLEEEAVDLDYWNQSPGDDDDDIPF
ncbi:DNA polymerase III subunit gamma/tau [Prochlorothrix hollandica]|uniref:DNA polymerase III subunit gamma/tau n=1 Tax=Prochlorothrix hollandica TaxID=1223 RepID=UPI000381EA85|nr:DNA polymerase III subunit gamma/tau [Prochlorothrix hollandica]